MKKKYSVWNQYCYMSKHLWAYDWKLGVRTILEIITNALRPLAGVMLPAFIVGLLEKGCDVKTLILSCLLVFSAVGLLYGAASYLSQRNWMPYCFLRIERFWSVLLEKCMVMDYALYEKQDVQNARDKASGALSFNGKGVEGFYHLNVALFTSTLGLVIYSLVISRVHPILVVLLLGLSVLQYVFYVIARKYEEKHRGEQADRWRHQWYFFGEATDVKAGKDARLYQLQNWLTALFERYNREYQTQDTKTKGFYLLYDLVGLLLAFLRDGFCYGYLIYLLAQGMDISEFVLYLGVVGGFGSWFHQISDNVANISGCLVQIGEFREFVDMENVYLHDSGEVLNLKSEESFDIVFEDVSFQYPGAEAPVLEHVSFHIPAGEKLALVGVNGAGKTTLVKMLCGFYRPTGGRILINGVDITQLNIEKYFEQVSVLFQDSVQFSYTIAQNITGQRDADMDRSKLQHVLKQSGLAEKIETLVKKEDTYIGKDIDPEGIQLSGGQIQKMFLARALYKNAHMLILDEPTAALDAIAESEMYDQYAELVQNKTSIFISHRLSSTRFCDRIFFLENGRIKECGSHQELMARNGSYAEMFRVQSQYYVREDEKV